MKSAFKLGFTWLFVMLLLPPMMGVAQQEFNKTIKREFDVSPDGTTSLSNKYGKIEVKTWEMEKVKISVNILVDARNEDQAQEIFDRININFSDAPDLVRAETVIEPRKKSWWGGGNNDVNYSINYEVFLPPTHDLELNHKYGEVYIAELSGRANMDIRYANLKAEGLGDDSRIRLGYGNGLLNTAQDINLELSYSKLSVEKASEVEVSSRYSRLTIKEASDITSQSKYDTYDLGSIRDFKNTGNYDNIRIERAQNVEVGSRYTEIELGQVANTLDLDLEYGGVSTGLASSFKQVSLNGRHTDFKLSIAAGSNYLLDASATFAGIRYPDALQVTYEVEKGTEHEIRGHVGRENAEAKVVARLSYGSLKVSGN
ncbi:MAG: hypothetical protein R3350_00155 [Saprospiraceae bacterium]|nr:hypothetical protein [Saprospiraceae bacterium]